MLCLGVVFLVSSAQSSLSFLDLWIYSFFLNLDVQYFFKYVAPRPTHTQLRITITRILGCLKLSQSQLRLRSFFSVLFFPFMFLLDSFSCRTYVFRLIFSSAAYNLLLVLFIVCVCVCSRYCPFHFQKFYLSIFNIFSLFFTSASFLVPFEHMEYI